MQAVGRVMRKSEGKRFGYIVVPVVLPPGCDVIKALEARTDGYRTLGQVLRALQSHDSRLPETPANFIRAYELSADEGLPADESVISEGSEPLQGVLAVEGGGAGDLRSYWGCGWDWANSRRILRRRLLARFGGRAGY